VTFAILYGFFSGGYVSLISPVFVSMANNVSEIGRVALVSPPLLHPDLNPPPIPRDRIRMGMAFVCVGLAALAGSPIAGALLVRTPNFVAPIIFSGTSSSSSSRQFPLQTNTHDRLYSGM
jgi:MCP family monocarboxylic acid transporter-like MFS transporter 10